MEQKSNSLSRVKRHQSEKVLRFSIRKYSFGAASVAVAALMFLGTHGVSADNIEVKPDGVTADVVDNKVGEGKATNVLVDDSRTAEVANATTDNTGTPVAFGNKVEQPKDTVVPNSVEAPNLKQQKADTVDKTKLSKVVGELNQLLDSKKTLKSSVVSLIKVRLLKAQVLLTSSDAVQGDIDSLAETLSNDFTTLSSLKDEELQNEEHSNNAEDGNRVAGSEEVGSSVNGKNKLNASVAELEAAVLELPEDESTKEVLGKAKELLSLAQSTLANTTVVASEVEDLTGRVKRMFNSVKIATLRLTSGSHDPRNGRSMGVGSQFRADSSTTSGALTNIKYFASVNPRGTTRNNNPELTKTKTDIKSYYVQDSEGKWIVYDVFFNNNAKRIVSPGQKQHYYFQLPYNIMDSSNTVRDLTFTRYKSVGGTRLSDGFDGFVPYGNEARISQGEVFAGQKDRIFNNDRYTMYDPNSGAYTDDRKKQVFKSNANDQTLNTAVRDKNGNYPRASYYLGLDIAPGENLDYAIHMHAKVKLKNDVTEAEANRYGRVFAATVGEQIASNESYVMYGTTALTPRDTTPPTITANNATVTKNEAIPAISVTAVDNNGGVGMRTTKPIEVTGLPTGLSYANNQITGTPTAAKGNYNVTIKAYDKNNNPATKNIVITVQEQTAKYNPTGAELTVNQNHVPTDAEITGKVSGHGPGTLTVVSKPATATAGNAGNAVVRVTYPDTSTDTVNVPIKVKDVTGPSITANGATVTRKEAITAIPVTVADNTGGVGLRGQNAVQVTGLPTGLSYANNQITGTPTAAKGNYNVTITAYDKNDNPTTKTITIKVQDQTDKYNPTGAELTVNQNHTLTDAEITGKVSGHGPGTLTVVSKPATATAGNAGNAVVRVTYPDTSTDTVNVPIKVKDVTGPTITANGATVTRKEAITAIPVTVADNTGGVGLRGQNPVQVTGLPTGLSYANNQITGTPTAAKGNYNVTIKAYDKNNNPATKNIVITVQEQTDKYNPTGAELTVNQNHTLTDAEITGKVSGHGPGTLTVVSKPATATAGNAGNAVVRVTYPDTSTDTVNVPIKVKDVTGPTVTANGATVTRKEAITAIPVTVADNTGGVGLRGQNPVQVTGLPTGLSYANNQITGTPTAAKGNYNITITAYDKNDNPTTKTITIKVQEQTEKYNPTGAELTVNQNHVPTDAEITGKVSGHGPGTLTVVSKPATATAGNAGNAVVRVTYPDTSTDTVNVPIKVKDVTGPTVTANGATVTRKEAITAIPVTVADNTGGVGLRGQNPVQVTGLPTGLSYANNQITGTPTAAKGNYNVTITAYDKNDNPTTKTITIKVQEQTEKYNPTGAELTVNQNHVPTDAEITGKVSGHGPGTLTVVSKPATATAGNAGNAVVRVTYPDTSTDTVNVPIKVKDVTGPSITANGATITRKEAITAIPVTVADNTGGVGLRGQNPVQVTGLPTGLSYANNQITGTPTAAKGNYNVTITAYDKNDNPTTETITIKVQEQTDKYNPTGEELTVDQNHVLTDAEITAKVKDFGPGRLTVESKPSTATVGDAGNAVVKVTYPDGSSDTVNVPVKVKDVTGPTITANGATVTKNEPITAIPVTVADNQGGRGLRQENPVQVTGLPEGLTYADGEITGTPTAPKGDYSVTITAYDKDDNPTTETITIKVQEQTDKYNPTGEELTVDQNHVLTDAEITAKVKDFGPGRLTVESKPSTATVGDAGNAVVKVTYPDGSSDTVNVPVKVRDVTGPSITANGATVTKNEPITPIPVTVADNQGGRGLRQENPVQVTGLPEGLTYADGEITGTPTAPKGNYNVTITAYDKDGNPTTETITIKVQEQTDKYNPTGEELTVDQNHVLTDAEITAKVKDFGPGTLTVESKPSTATVGDAGNAVVKVTYPDGSSDTVNVPVKVRDVTGPSITANGATVTKNEPITPIPVTVADNQGGRGLRQENPVQVTGLPEGLTYADGEITGTPTAPKGNYNVTITAYDKDGNPTTETITIKVQEQTDKYNPKYDDGQGKPGTKVEIPVTEETGKPIPEGTKFESATPGITVDDKGKVTVTIPEDKNPGDEITGKVTVTYPDGSKEEIPVKVTVTKRDKDIYNPKYDDGQGKPGTKVEIPVTEETGKPIPAGTKFESDTPGITVDDKGKVTVTIPEDKNPGDEITGKVTVTYPDGSKEEIPVKVTVTKRDKDIYNPKYDDGQGKPGTKVEIPVTEETGKPLPEGTKFESDTPGITVDDKGKVTVTIPEDKNPGDEITGKVTVTYPDGSKEEIPVKVTVTKRDKDIYNPKYDDGQGKPGTKVEIPVTEETGKPIPAGTKFESDTPGITVDDKGKVTVTIPEDKNPGDEITGKVTVTYPDGSKEEIPVKVTVTKRDKDIYNPKYDDGQGKPGTKVEIPVTEETGKPIPAGTKFESDTPGITVDDKGKVTVTIPEDKNPGDEITGKVTVTYPDGSKEEIPVKVTVTKRDKDIYNPKYDDGQGKPGTKVEIPVTEETGKPIPAGTKFESDTPGITVDDKGKVTVTISEDKNPGDEITGKVTVTYPDGSKEEIPVKVTVTKRDKDIYNPKYDDGQGKPGTKVEIPVTEETGKPLPEGTKFESDTPGITVDDKGKVTVTIPEDKNPGDEITGKVTVTYPDGSKEEIPVKVTVTKRDKDIYNPKYDDGQGKPGTKVEIPVTEETGKPLPEGTKFESATPGITVDDKGKVTVTIPEDKNPGDKITGKVTVTYPDGSKEEIPVKVTVTKRDKDIYNPKYDDGQGKPGTKVEIPVTEETGKPLPEGTKFESDTPGITVDDKGKVTVTIPEDKNPGDEITGKVTVTYPDGSKEEIPVKITVTKRDKDIYNPKYDDGQGKPGTKVEIPVTEETGKPIPEGTKFESDTPGITVDDKGKVTVTIPEDKNPGDEITGKVTVTYPDGSKEEIPVKVTVTKRDKDIYNPKYDDGQGKPGTKVEIPVTEETGKPIPPVTPNTNENRYNTRDDEVKSNDSQNVLPNTGTESSATLATLGIIGVLSGFGLVAGKKKEE